MKPLMATTIIICCTTRYFHLAMLARSGFVSLRLSLVPASAPPDNGSVRSAIAAAGNEHSHAMHNFHVIISRCAKYCLSFRTSRTDKFSLMVRFDRLRRPNGKGRKWSSSSSRININLSQFRAINGKTPFVNVESFRFNYLIPNA